MIVKASNHLVGCVLTAVLSADPQHWEPTASVLLRWGNSDGSSKQREHMVLLVIFYLYDAALWLTTGDRWCPKSSLEWGRHKTSEKPYEQDTGKTWSGLYLGNRAIGFLCSYYGSLQLFSNFVTPNHDQCNWSSVPSSFFFLHNMQENESLMRINRATVHDECIEMSDYFWSLHQRAVVRKP